MPFLGEIQEYSSVCMQPRHIEVSYERVQEYPGG